jgi:hypothetical protein
MSHFNICAVMQKDMTAQYFRNGTGRGVVTILYYSLQLILHTSLHYLVHRRCGAVRVETKMPFSIFAKMRKSCENGPIFAKFREISKI